jgi:phage tail-like protein
MNDEAQSIDLNGGGTMFVSGVVTYAGSGGFGAVRTQPSTGELPPPEVVSARGYLREALPGLYRDGDFAMRFVGALEAVLDPVVGILDALPAHFDPDLAPVDVLGLETAWLGLEYDESQPTDQLRSLVRHAAELGRMRGTRAGLELALSLSFPDLPLRVEDSGSVTWTTDAVAAPTPAAPGFVVYCDTPIPDERQAAIARLIEAVKPVHVPYRLRVRVSRRKQQQEQPPEEEQPS